MVAPEAHLGGFSGVLPGGQRRLEDSLHRSGVGVAETGALVCSTGECHRQVSRVPGASPSSRAVGSGSLLLLSAHVVMLWNISLFPGLSSIVPACSSTNAAAHQHPEMFQYQEASRSRFQLIGVPGQCSSASSSQPFQHSSRGRQYPASRKPFPTTTHLPSAGSSIPGPKAGAAGG